MSANRCPCGSGDTYDDCCEPLHAGRASAPTAQALMRSRFSAFAKAQAAYLIRTWHPSTRPATIELEPAQRWTHLEIVETIGGGPFASTGEVEFRAHYRTPSGPGVLHEHSSFVRHDGEWVYVSGR